MTISFTFSYMSNRISSVSSDSEPNMERRRKSLVTLVKFAAAMMVRLKGINKDAFQDFELRIGTRNAIRKKYVEFNY